MGVLGDVLENVCRQEDKLFLLFGFVTITMVLTLISFTVIDEGSPTYVIAVVDMVGLVVLELFLGGVLLQCRRLRQP